MSDSGTDARKVATVLGVTLTIALGVLISACAHAPAASTPPSARWHSLGAPAPVNELSFADSRYGWMIQSGDLYDTLVSGGHGLWTTTNGGRSWTLCRGRIQNHQSARLPPTVATIANPQTIQAAGRTVWLVYQGPRTARGYHAGVLVSTDGGANWHVSLTLPGSANLVSNSAFIDARRGWVVWTTDRTLHHWRWTLLRTRDGGTSWQRMTPPRSESPLPADFMQFVNSQVGYTLSDVDDAVWRTTDGGASWRPCNGASWAGQPQFFALSARDLWLGTASFGYESSPDLHEGQLFHSSDGGATWQVPSQAFAGIPVERIYFVNRLDGWVAGNDSAGNDVIYATHDGGRHWIQELDVGPRGSIDGLLGMGRDTVAWVWPDRSWNRAHSPYLYDLWPLPRS